MTTSIRYTPIETIDLDDIRQAVHDEANNVLHITFHNGDMLDISLSSGGDFIWEAHCARCLDLFGG